MSDEQIVTRVRVVYDDQPVHCIDIVDGIGTRLVRIRPQGDSACWFDMGDGRSSFVNADDLDDLVSALSRLQRQKSGASGDRKEPAQ